MPMVRVSNGGTSELKKLYLSSASSYDEVHVDDPITITTLTAVGRVFWVYVGSGVSTISWSSLTNAGFSIRMYNSSGTALGSVATTSSFSYNFRSAYPTTSKLYFMIDNTGSTTYNFTNFKLS